MIEFESFDEQGAADAAENAVAILELSLRDFVGV